MKHEYFNTLFATTFIPSKDDVDNRSTVKESSVSPVQSPTSTQPSLMNSNTVPSSPTTATLQNGNNSALSSDMCHEELRFRSFGTKWPHQFIETRILAKTGFYFIGPYDQVKCYFCKVEVGCWENGDNEVIEHSRWSPNCPLLKRRETTNVPIEPITELDQLLPPLSYDVCGPCGIDIRPGSYSESSYSSSPATSQSSQSPTFTSSSIGFTVEQETQTLKPADFPEFAIETARLRSFDDWPKTIKQKPQQLSDAGFFYTQKGDRVRCFSCGGGLRDWDENDDPWEQHALWFSNCEYLKLIKGQEYIDSVKEKQQKLDAEKNVLTTLSQESIASTASSNGPLATTTAKTIAMPAQSAERDETNQETKLCESRLCKICYSSEYNTAFFPCGHVIACTKCASSVTKCPLCRKPFERVMRVFFS